MAIFAHVPKRSKGEVCKTSKPEGSRKFDSYRALEMLNSKGDDMTFSKKDLEFSPSLVEYEMAKILEDKAIFKNATLPNRDILNKVCDLYRPAAAAHGAKLWRVWDKFNKDTNAYTVTVEIFKGKDKLVLEHTAKPADVA